MHHDGARRDAMTVANEAQIACWNEDVGRRWAEQQARLDALIAPFGAAALQKAHARASESVLDVGCGCGDTSLALAAAVGATGRVLGVDVSAPMLERARARAAGQANLAFRLGDAASAPLDGPYDLLFSRFGVMFFDAPSDAFAHLRAAMKAGGRMTFVCWRPLADNPWASVPAFAAMRVLGPPKQAPDPHAPGPFAFGDRDRLHAILEAAGWRTIEIAPFDAPMQMGGDAVDAARWSAQMGPVGALLRELDDEAKREAVIAAVADALAPHANADGVRLAGGTWIVSASA
jgi:SAM-dependent methyltransferase